MTHGDAGAATDVDATAGVASDGRPWVHPQDRAAWRTWLIANHATSRGVYLAGWRKASGRTPIDYVAATEEALCVGWIDSKATVLDEERSLLWFSPRKPGSGSWRPPRRRMPKTSSD